MERYYSFPDYCLKTYGRKLYRIPLDAGMSCPNRDGTIATGGCIFCDEGGSGDFACHYHGQRLYPAEIPYVRNPDSPAGSFIGYFQAYTNTYASLDKLKFLFSSALSDPMLAGISIATRPDCLGANVLSLLQTLKQSYSDKFIWIELGLQTMHEKTAVLINRGYPLSAFDKAVHDLHALDIPVIVHVILGLPYETEKMMYETIEHLNKVQIDGIKLQLLHVLKNTKLSEMYHQNAFHILSEQEYLHLVCGCISRLSDNVVIHRLTGDGNPQILEAPLWSLHKKKVLNAIGHELKVENITQGCLLKGEK